MITQYSKKNLNCKIYFADWINQLRYVKTGMYCDDNGIYLRKTEKRYFLHVENTKLRSKKELKLSETLMAFNYKEKDNLNKKINILNIF